MKKSTHAPLMVQFKKMTAASYVLAALISLALFQDVQAQCSLACNRYSQVSLNEICNTEVTPDMILNAAQTSCNGGDFEVTVSEKGVPILTSPNVNRDHIGLTLTVEVRDLVSGNRCWGEILVEDKQPPSINCVPDTLYCYEARDYLGPEVEDNCDESVEIILLNEVIEPLNCDEEFVKRVYRTYYAVDEYGNQSQPCTQEILLRRFPHDEAFGPDDYSVAEGNPLMCQSEYELDGQGHPHPNVTGVPMVDTFRLWPSQDFYCNLNVSYSDVVLPIRGCVTSIMRLWTLREWWCSTEEVTTFTQVIEIVDNQGPVVTVPQDMTVTTTGRFTCEAIVNLPPATVFDSCSGNNVTVDVQYPGGFLQNQNGGQITLPVGENEIVYTAYDACYNSTSEVMLVTVEDNTAPVAICDKNTVVGITYDGFADVYAHTFDDGSYDDCWIDSIAVKRMDNGGNCSPGQNQFGPFVTFCCIDIAAGPITVIMKVWDEAGNSNECMVLIEAQDKLPPEITCPPNLTISCDYHLDRENLDVFGTVVESKDDQEDIEIAPPFLLDWDGLLIDGLAHDNCQIEIFEEETFDISQCNVGTITRVFTAEDPNGFAECTQTITIVNTEPFNVSTDVVWPLDYETDESCDVGSLQPDALPSPFSEPVITEDRCDLVGTTFSDEVFPFADSNACFKIIRTWKIVDWCQLNGSIYGEWTHQQVIKVHNTVAPEILSDCEPVSAETFDPNCEEGFIELFAEATDDCTPDAELMNSYAIDLFSTGSFGPPQVGSGPEIDASGEYPVGTHQIKYSFEDRCGNKVSCTQEFSIINRKAPTVYCQNGIVVDLMPMDLDGDGEVDDGMVEIWAEDFDAGSTHSCGYELTFSFDSLGLELARIYNCDSLANGPELEVIIYVTDEEGNQGSCNNLIILQDNQGACVNNITSAVIGGRVATESNEFVSEVAVDLQGSGITPLMTKNDGAYAFPAMPHGGNYTVAPGKQDDHMNGVSTADLILIQRHLLGIVSLDSPYKLIAADANNSGDISARDIIELRKLILGLTKELPSSPSWRFIDNAYTFADPTNPFAEKWRENYEIKGLNGHMMNVDFVGVKIGDVNGSAKANAVSQPQIRDNNKLKLVVEDVSFKAGDIVQVPVYSSEAISLAGYQFTLNYDSDVLHWVDYESGQVPLQSGHFGLMFTDRGLVTTSWNGESTTLQTENAMFSMTFRASRDGSLGELLLISSDITSAEAYTNGGVDTRGLQLEVRNAAVTENGLTLYQNTPNPFADETTIRFHLGQSEGAVLTIFDVNGKALYTRDIIGYKGVNEVIVQADELPGSGVLYYQVDTKSHRATKRMILLK